MASASSRLSDKGGDPGSTESSGPVDGPQKKRQLRRKATEDSSATPPSSAQIDAQLRGNTLRAYLFIMKLSKPIGVRELQRALELSSPSVAYHHIEKVERLGLVEKNEYGSYAVVKNIDVNVLQAFARIGALLVPRFIFYAMFFTTLLFSYLLIYQVDANVYAVVFGAAGAAFAWFETIRTWQRRPF